MVSSKTGTAGRFGPRYGRKIRHIVSEVERKLRAWHKCPYCKKVRAKRLSSGIWECRSCNSKFTGKAYTV